jgi:uncharacterized membrane protein
MGSFLVVVFPDEASTNGAAQALRSLHASGTIALYGLALVVREVDGTLALRVPASLGSLGAAVGIVVDTLTRFGSSPQSIGMGASSRAPLGVLGEFLNLGLGVDFIEETSRAILPACAAIVAEIGEHWLAPVDLRMAAMGGTIVRRQRADTAAQQVRQEVEALDAELSQLEQEADRLGGHARKAISMRADAIRARLEAANLRAEAMLSRLQQEMEAKMEALLAQLERAGAEVEVKVEAEAKIGHAVAEMQAEAALRTVALTRAVELARSALGLDAPE